MLSNKTIEAVKNLWAKLSVEVPAKPVVKLEDVTLMDGTILTVDKMEVGSPATFTGADGVAIPAEGAYEYEGGTIVCAAGVVTEIKPKEADKQPEPNPAAPSEEMAAILSRLSTIEEAYKKSLATNQTLEAQLSENKKAVVVALQAIEEFNTTAVAVSLEAASKGKAKVVKAYEEMSKHEQLLFNKGKLS